MAKKGILTRFERSKSVRHAAVAEGAIAVLVALELELTASAAVAIALVVARLRQPPLLLNVETQERLRCRPAPCGKRVAVKVLQDVAWCAWARLRLTAPLQLRVCNLEECLYRLSSLKRPCMFKAETFMKSEWYPRQ